jgi:hypothetical protein
MTVSRTRRIFDMQPIRQNPKVFKRAKIAFLSLSDNWNHLFGTKFDNTDFEDSHDAKSTLSAYMSQRNYQDNTISSHRSFSHES